MVDRVRVKFPLQDIYLGMQPDTQANSAFHPSFGKWGPSLTGKKKAGMVHSVSGWTRGVQIKLWNPLRTRAMPERLRGVFTTRRYTNPRLPLPLPCSSTVNDWVTVEGYSDVSVVTAFNKHTGRFTGAVCWRYCLLFTAMRAWCSRETATQGADCQTGTTHPTLRASSKGHFRSVCVVQ